MIAAAVAVVITLSGLVQVAAMVVSGPDAGSAGHEQPAPITVAMSSDAGAIPALPANRVGEGLEWSELPLNRMDGVLFALGALVVAVTIHLIGRSPGGPAAWPTDVQVAEGA